MAMTGEVIKRQHFYHQGYTILHPKSGYVATKLPRTSTCGCNNNIMRSFQTELFSRFLLSAYGSSPMPGVVVDFLHNDTTSYRL